MRVLQMLTKVISAEELLRLVALSKFVDVVEMFRADIPLRWVRKLFAAVATQVRTTRGL